HISQRHLARAFESASKSQLPIALAMLGAIVAAQAAGNSSGDLAQAAVVSGTALMQQQLINFTRGNEYEADRIGIQTLGRAGFDVQGVPDFFARMHRANRANGSEIPEFLRTHPVDTSRIAEAKGRASQILREKNISPSKGSAVVDMPLTVPRLQVTTTAPDAQSHAASNEALPAYLVFRERVRVLASPTPSLLVQDYRRHLESATEARNAESGVLTNARRYGLGLALVRAGRPEDALPILTTLVQAQPESIPIQLALAEAESLAGRHAQAVERVNQLDRRRPGERAITQALATVLLAQSRKDDALQATRRLKPVLEKLDADAALIETYARASQLAGDEVRAGEMYAELTLLNGRPDDAMGQLRGLLDRSDVDHYQRARIEARIAQITPWALFVQEERRKRRVE
ncbi:MAG: M48 family metalloprotease, partial [Lysobacterales bacterium]